MTNVPKIVRERLQVGSPPVIHPDTDVLNAFSERSLTEREQEVVLEHLSRCGECREIVALALPAEESVPSVTWKSSRGMFAWPAFRWGFVTAGLAAIALVGAFQYQRHARTTMVAYQSPPAAGSEARNELPTAPAASVTATQVTREESKESDKGLDKVQGNALSKGATRYVTGENSVAPPPAEALRRDQAADTATGTPAKSSRAWHGALPHGPRQSNQWQQLNANNSNSNLAYNAAPPPPASVTAAPAAKQQVGARPTAAPAEERIGQSSEMVEVQAQSQAPVAETTPTAGGLLVKNEPIPQTRDGSGQADTKVDRAKPAFGGAAGAKTLAESDSSQLQARSLKALLDSPRWNISSSGNLQKSSDQGATWQDVSVNNRSGYAETASLEVSVARAKSKDVAKAGKKEAQNGPIFRTVVANGAEVWAGGASGLLYHSSDAGLHWSQVAPSSAGVVLTGDILSMEFPDTQHGRISTSTSETWTTADGGQTWQKQ